MQLNTVILVLSALTSVAVARNLRCPSEVSTNSLFSNRLSPNKFFRCSEFRLIEEFECDDGLLFDPTLLICHKPIAGRCLCPQAQVIPYVKECENCRPGEIFTRMPGFLVTSPPSLAYDKFGSEDKPLGLIIVTDPPLPPC